MLRPTSPSSRRGPRRASWVRRGALLLALALAAPATRALFWHSPHDVIDAWAISPDFAHDRTLFVSLGRFNVLLRSRDAAQSFEVVNAGLQTGDVRCVSISPDYARDRTLYCAEATRAYVTHDAGDHWADVALPPEVRVVRSLALSPDFAHDG